MASTRSLVPYNPGLQRVDQLDDDLASVETSGPAQAAQRVTTSAPPRDLRGLPRFRDGRTSRANALAEQPVNTSSQPIVDPTGTGMFALVTPAGDVTDLFHAETQRLSMLRLGLNDMRPACLGAFIRHGIVHSSTLTNRPPDATPTETARPDDGTVVLERETFIGDRRLYQRIKMTNRTWRNDGSESAAVTARLSIELAAPFIDLFERRQMKRKQRGTQLAPVIRGNEVVLSYEGLDGKRRHTRIRFSEKPQIAIWRQEEGELDGVFHVLAEFEARLEAPAVSDSGNQVAGRERNAPSPSRLDLESGKQIFLQVEYFDLEETESDAPHLVDDPIGPAGFRAAKASAMRALHAKSTRGAMVFGSRDDRSGQYEHWISESNRQTALLLAHPSAVLPELNLPPSGSYPNAGIPWFNVPFGRDALIASLMSLSYDPEIGKSTLLFLASTQGKESNAATYEEPGAILHEIRTGEMATLHEHAFSKTYGSIDAPGLFLTAAFEYELRTGDSETISEIWHELEQSWRWMTTKLYTNQNGILTWKRSANDHLPVRSWRDSFDSICHSDGRLAMGDIAASDVQGQAYHALLCFEQMARRRGYGDIAAESRNLAIRLQETVERLFWMDDYGFYGSAIDESGLCRVLNSDCADLLLTGLIKDPVRARKVMERLLSRDFNSGWGIRTLAAGQPRYDPTSYHNGSVWPHRVARIAQGFAKYGNYAGAAILADQMLDAAVSFDYQVGELFCGFERTNDAPPIPYPVSCNPQVWVTRAPGAMLEASLGLEVNAKERSIRIASDARLPKGVRAFTFDDVRIGDEKLRFTVEREDNGFVRATLLTRGSDVQLVRY